MHDPREIHLEAAYRVLHYLKAHPGKGILFKKTLDIVLAISTNGDFVGSPLDRRSTIGYCTFLGGNLLSSRSKKQNVVARSSVEVEFRDQHHRLSEALGEKKVDQKNVSTGCWETHLSCTY